MILSRIKNFRDKCLSINFSALNFFYNIFLKNSIKGIIRYIIIKYKIIVENNLSSTYY